MSGNTSMTLQVSDLTVSVPGRTLVSSLDLSVKAGEFVAVLGRNGTGKTLTLHTVAGLRPTEAGKVMLEGELLSDMDRKDAARCLALLPQHSDDIFPASVLDTVLIGRHPHIPRFGWESADDIDASRKALASVQLDELSDRDVLSLSGGERRRLAIAQIIAQNPSVFLLDEPTNHLDPQHQLDAVALFRQKANEGASVLASLHDVNLAARFADRCLFLYGDGRWEIGPVNEILTAASLSELYGTAMQAVPWESTSLFFATG